MFGFVELLKLFFLIFLVVEEDFFFLCENNFVSFVVSEVIVKVSVGDDCLFDVDVFEVIDRGGKDVYIFCNKFVIYWVMLYF